MALTKALDALTVIGRSNPPESKQDAAKVVKHVTADALEPLREWLDEVTGRLEDAEQSASDLEESDAEDREAFFDNLVSSAGELRDRLAELSGLTSTTG